MIHRALKLLRTYHSLKQKDLAERLTISQSHLSEIENGTKPVSFELLERYSQIFDLPISAITFFSEIGLAQKEERDSFPVSVTGKALSFLEWLDLTKKFHETGE